MNERKEPYLTVEWMGQKIDYSFGENPYPKDSFHEQMWNEIDKQLWIGLGGPESLAAAEEA